MSSSSVSTDILQIVKQYTLWSGCIISIFGIIGNTLNILIFTQLKLFRFNRSAFYITVESISNFFYQFIAISLIILTAIYGDDVTSRSLAWCRLRFILSLTIVITTYYMTCCAAIDQFFSTNYHVNLLQICTLKVARYVTITLVSFGIIHSIIFGFLAYNIPLIGCVISNPIFLQYATFFFYPVLAGLLPIVIAAIFSLLAYRNVRRIIRRQLPILRRRLDRQMTAMVLSRVIIFVCLALPYSIYRIYAINSPASRSQPLEFAIAQLLQAIFFSLVTLNYTVSFYVFMISSPRFRRQVKYVLVKKCWNLCKFWCCLRNNQTHPENIEQINSHMVLEEV
ncbi:unnamed protein product [Adineta steineri]|uniref:G-protein coupled receptors family 1 profile domain-containing protein n=1 Tax=Adineta steineri TaxID=433720 RepID=A0A816DVA4_9BILA|nr:unnamed protein product [Adineta steineri]CAF1640806.1 unnamed protein product [Adineta steineri]